MHRQNELPRLDTPLKGAETLTADQKEFEELCFKAWRIWFGHEPEDFGTARASRISAEISR
jgi:hypothetical protein